MTPNHAQSAPQRVAGIDCGTNSLRLLIADKTADGTLVDHVRRMEVVRLGEGVDRTGRFSAAAIERTRLALADYTEQIRDHQVPAVRMTATSASRDASNAGEFTAMVNELLGIDPEVISGDEEARLSFYGAVSNLPAFDGDRLLVDIGGGSTEFVRGKHTDVIAARSVDMGCVRMSERHLHSDPPTAAEITAAVDDIRRHTDGALDTVDPQKLSRKLVGVAGTVTTLAGMSLNLDGYDADAIDGTEVTYDEICHIVNELANMTQQQRLAIGVMHPGRADVIVGGALVVRTIMEQTGAPTILASEHDILDGIASTATELTDRPPAVAKGHHKNRSDRPAIHHLVLNRRGTFGDIGHDHRDVIGATSAQC